MLTYYLLAFAFILIVSLIYFLVLNVSYNSAKIKKIILFILVFTIVLTIPALVSKISSITESITWFVVLQVLYVGLGIGCYFLLEKTSFFGEFKNPPLSNTLLIVIFMASGYLGFTFLFNYLLDRHDQNVGHLFGMAILPFVVPQLFMISFDILISIPHEIHKVWYFPGEDDLPDLDNEDLNVIISIEIEFTRNPALNDSIIFKAKAPVSLLFKDWFHYFVINYNEKFKENPIKMRDEQQNTYGWVFFTKPSFWETKRYVDFNLSITDNKIQDNKILVAKRVTISENTNQY